MNNGHESASKQDVVDSVKASEDRVVGTMRDIQTEILKAFYSFAESNRRRVVQLEVNQGALITRIGVLEDRMLELERKVNFPQQPPQ
ncbi:MAG TPA: hypothetical protein VKF41_06130 [Bryobacteraceae bacterium]|nr:hypothetical protein [Bryobacteraceae bacterium]